MMEILQIIDFNLFALLILIIISLKVRHFPLESYSQKIFNSMVKVAIVLIIAESVTWVVNGRPGLTMLVLHHFFNAIEYIFTIMPAVLWYLYADYQIFHKPSHSKNSSVLLTLLFLINATFTLLSISNGFFFYIDENNFYHRGEYFGLHVTLSYALVAYTTLKIIYHKNKVERSYYLAMLAFPLPQIIGGILQVYFYGLSLLWSSLVLSILIVYLNIQEDYANTDFLTGAYNRRLLDKILSKKIKSLGKRNTFSGILLDIDSFKEINDNFGHDIGDKALKEVVQIVGQCLSPRDIIARLGGDEFFILLEEDDPQRLEKVVKSISWTAKNFNDNSASGYKIHLSVGYAVYDPAIHRNPEGFFKALDERMYKEKRNSRP